MRTANTTQSDRASPRRQATAFFTDMAKDNIRPMGPGCHHGVWDPFSCDTPKCKAISFPFLNGGYQYHFRSGQQTFEDTGHQSSFLRGRICEQCLSGSKESREVETDSQPEGPEWFCGASALQNGGYSLSQRPLESRRLHVQAGPERGLPFCSGQGPVSEILMAGKNVSIQRSAFRSVDSSQSFHQNIEACSGLSPCQRTEDSGILGRLSDHREYQGESRGGLQAHKVAPREPGFHSKLREISVRGINTNRIPKGFLIDSIQMKFELPSAKVQEIAGKWLINHQCRYHNWPR